VYINRKSKILKQYYRRKESSGKIIMARKVRAWRDRKWEAIATMKMATYMHLNRKGYSKVLAIFWRSAVGFPQIDL